MNKQFDLNKFNSLIDSATNAILCDSECQRNNAADELKNKYLNAKENLVLAEPKYEMAKQKYYTYVSGQNGYDEMIEKELNEKADLFIEKFKENYNAEKSKLVTQLDSYSGLLINFNNIIDLSEKYKKENKKLTKQLKEDTNDILTNERKTFYEDQQNETLNFYYYYFMLTIYYIIVISYFFFSLTYPSTFSWGSRMFIGVLFIILPFISTWLLGCAISIFYWFYSLLPKNTYLS